MTAPEVPPAVQKQLDVLNSTARPGEKFVFSVAMGGILAVPDPTSMPADTTPPIHDPATGKFTFPGKYGDRILKGANDLAQCDPTLRTWDVACSPCGINVPPGQGTLVETEPYGRKRIRCNTCSARPESVLALTQAAAMGVRDDIPEGLPDAAWHTALSRMPRGSMIELSSPDVAWYYKGHDVAWAHLRPDHLDGLVAQLKTASNQYMATTVQVRNERCASCGAVAYIPGKTLQGQRRTYQTCTQCEPSLQHAVGGVGHTLGSRAAFKHSLKAKKSSTRVGYLLDDGDPAKEDPAASGDRWHVAWSDVEARWLAAGFEPIASYDGAWDYLAIERTRILALRTERQLNTIEATKAATQRIASW